MFNSFRLVKLFATLLFCSELSPVQTSKLFHARTAASHGFSIPLTRYASSQSIKEMVIWDRWRMNTILDAAASSDTRSTIPIQTFGVSYIANVTVGETIHSLIVDTGSAITWIGTYEDYQPSPLSKKSNVIFNVTYGSGSLVAEVYADRVSLSPEITIPNQIIGVAERNETNGFGAPFDGILGVGPSILTFGSVRVNKKKIYKTVPTVTDTLYSEGTINSKSVGISFRVSNSNATNGVITFGGVDNSRYVGDIVYATPDKYPFSEYFSLEARFLYDGKDITSSSAPASCLIDTGTTLIYIPKEAYENYVDLTGSRVDNDTQLLRIPNSEVGKLKTLSVVIGEITYPLNPTAQQWPHAINYELNGDSDSTYLLIGSSGGGGDSSSSNEAGGRCILGQSFLERFYAVFDTSDSASSDKQVNRVGLALAPWTFDT